MKSSLVDIHNSKNFVNVDYLLNTNFTMEELKCITNPKNNTSPYNNYIKSTKKVKTFLSYEEIAKKNNINISKKYL